MNNTKQNKKAYYIIYRLEDNDIVNSYDSDNLNKIAEWLNITYKNTSQYIVKDLGDINSKLKYLYNHKYFIFKDYE